MKYFLLYTLLMISALFVSCGTGDSYHPENNPVNSNDYSKAEEADKTSPSTINDEIKEDKVNIERINVNNLKKYEETGDIKTDENEAYNKVLSVLGVEKPEPPEDISYGGLYSAEDIVFHKFYYYENLKSTEANMSNILECFYVDAGNGNVYIEDRETQYLLEVDSWEREY